MEVHLCSLGILLSLLVYCQHSDGQGRPNWDMPRFGGRDWGQSGFNFDLGQSDRGRNPFGSFRPNQAPTQQPPIVGQIPGQIGQRGVENQPPPLPPMPQEPGQVGQGELPAPSQPPPDQGPTPLEPQPSPGPDGMGPGMLGGFSPSEFPPLFLSSTSPSPELGDRGFGGAGGGGFPSLGGPNEIGGMPGMLGPGMGQGPRGFGDFRPGFGGGQGSPAEQGGQENTSVPSMGQRGSMGTEQPPFLEDSQEAGKAKAPAEPLKQFGGQGQGRGRGHGDIFELSKSHGPGQKDGFKGKGIHPVPKPQVPRSKSPEVVEHGMSPEDNGVEPIKQVMKPGQVARPSQSQKGGRNLSSSKILVIPNTPDVKDAEFVPPSRGQRTTPPQIDVRRGGRGKGEQGGLEGAGQGRGGPDYTPRPPRGK